ncbi:helix-turn-helix transcriptional regulator [Frankia sp. CNm7]|uniref:Helix-turn-helix transcriptional regulator n=1 Tax=Frankia nepalensis TaxID=1836974 RepID=A0A937UU59_9ACTN|nr:helix-turn-helix domain-containing protein [Frankia nepalensis]MBL7498957.1 helix-turn-helix transcriptional regulator [Frankia nepalensis]MBL7511246.1 helix-turn-helix transcriptional regulator [Frankia nepalensis]MBL7520580.1 helix-turn-helix transcriptional regulator [Frankia nepalensis]MBL7630766.1 helix-turn-helix transcriptional regulator [Frankia nepalensis]
MQRTQFGDLVCSIARTLDLIGEPWSPLILRDVMVGIRRFDQIQADLGISRKVLTERLKWLVERGVLARREYSARPPRHEYVLTDQGVDLCDVLIAMARFGDRWLAGPAGPPVLYRHRPCGHVAPADLYCAHCDQPIRADAIDVLPGPGMTAEAETRT